MKRDAKDAGQQKLAMERVERLFELAENDLRSHPERSHRNVQMARKIAMRYNVRLPRELSRKFCRKCYKYLSPNVNCELKTRRGLTVSKCLGCGSVIKRRIKVYTK